MKKQFVNRLCTLLLLFFFLFDSGTVTISYASDRDIHANLLSGPQQNTWKGIVSGQVLDEETKEPLAGATVIIKGTTIGTTTDPDGKYMINTKIGNETLVVSFVGYNAAEEVINNRSIINFELRPTSSQSLDEVVVVGYGTQKKANVVGSVTTLRGSDIKSIPATSVTNALAGRLPGVVAMQKTGEPGNLGSKLMVRGRSTLGDDAKYTNPLVVIDGVQGRSMDEIDPNDVASVSVLKDASAAIYGAQAANGVILITTKSGEAGTGRPRLNYNFYQGFMTPSITPELCNSAEYATMLTEYQAYKGVTQKYEAKDIELFGNGQDPWEHPNTDWYGELIKKWTTTMRHNLTIDGGFKGMTYYVSLGYKKDDAIYKQSSTSYDQYNIRAKMNFPITDWLKADINTSYFETHRAFPFKSAGNIFASATRTVPTMPAFWPNGLPAPDVENGENPAVTSSFAGGKNEQKTYRSQNTFNVTITPPFIKGLTLNGSFDYDVNNYYKKEFYNQWILYYPNWEDATRDPQTGFVTDMPLTPSLRGDISSSRNTEQYERTVNKTWNVNASYARTFGDHDVTAYLGFEQYTNDINNFSGYREGYISNLIQIMNAGANLNKNASGSMTIYARKSLIGRFTYSYKDKYLAEFLYRRDGSLKFPPDSRWGNFPGFLLGWRVSEEGFWKNHIPFVNYFKLRASFGMMGMDPGDPFQYMNKYTLAKNNILGMVFGTGSNIETTLGPPTVANPYITWEKQKTQNYGFESQFLNGMFNLNFDYFYNIRTDILAARNASIPKFTGLSLPLENIARVDNKGFELEAGFHKSFNKDWRLDVGGNFSFNRNRVVFNDEPERAVAWQRRTGHPYGARLMYRAIGVFKDQDAIQNYPTWGERQDANGLWIPDPKTGLKQTTAMPGDLIFEDVNKDGKINSDDQILVDGCDAPEITYGLNFDLRWKSFTLSVLFQGQGTYYKENITDDRRGEAGNYPKWLYEDRWSVNNIDGAIPRPFNRSDQYWKSNQNTFWFDNTAYLRLKNLVLGYDIPVKYFRAIGITRANVYFSGNNLALLYTATKKFDPEVDGINVYPAMKTFAIGANITF